MHTWKIIKIVANNKNIVIDLKLFEIIFSKIKKRTSFAVVNL